MSHKPAFGLRPLSLPPACARRRRALGPFAYDIMLGRGAGRPFTAAAWLAFFLLCMISVESAARPLLLLSSSSLFLGLCALALFDARYFVIPDGPLLFLLAFGLATCLTLTPGETGARLGAAVLGFASLRFVAHGYEALRGAPGVGEGDARLFAVAGLWLGFEGLPSCLIYGVLSALLAAIIALRQGSLESARAPLPFGPHLALGLWLCWTVGPIQFT